MKIIAVFHSDKVEGLDGLPPEIAANPPMTIEGMKKIHALVPVIKKEAPTIFHIYCSCLARALDAASIIALAYKCIFHVDESLGQYANKDGGTVIAYPGHEGEGYEEWQQSALSFLAYFDEDRKDKDVCPLEEIDIIVVSHRPIIGGLVAATLGITGADEIKTIVNDPKLTDGGYRVFEYDGKNLTLVK